MQPSDADVVEARDFVAERLGGERRLLRYGHVARSAGRDYYRAAPVGLGHFASYADAPDFMVGERDGERDGSRRLRAHARDEHGFLSAVEHRLRYFRDLLRALARAVDDLGYALAQRAVAVYLREAEVAEGLLAQLLHDFVDCRGPRRETDEELPYIFLVHFLSALHVEKHRVEVRRERRFYLKVARRGAHYLRFWKLHARSAVEETHAQVREAERGERRLRPLDAPQHRGVDLRPGRNARREACVCGLVPREEPRLGGEAAYLGLSEAAFAQRRAHAHFAQRLHAGAVALVVGGVRAVHYQAESVALSLARYRAENPLFAQITALGRVRCDFRAIQNGERNHRHRRGKFVSETPPRVVELELRLEFALYVIGAEIGAAARGRVHQVRRVDAAREGERGARVFREKFFKSSDGGRRQKAHRNTSARTRRPADMTPSWREKYSVKNAANAAKAASAAAARPCGRVPEPARFALHSRESRIQHKRGSGLQVNGLF